MDRIKLGVLYGGTSIENEISKRSRDNIILSLDDEKYDITLYAIPKNGDKGWIKEFINNPPDIVLSALHGGKGENGTIQGFLHTLGIKYIGSKVLSSALCMDKYISKKILRQAKIQVPGDILVKKGEDPKVYTEELNELTYPVIAKPNRGGSSIGIAVCENMSSLELACKNIFDQYDDDVIIEKFISGSEVNCSVMETENDIEVLAVLDVKKEGAVFDFDDKYSAVQSIGSITTLPIFMQDMIKSIAKKAFKALRCRGYACVDMIVSAENIYVIEVHTLPGLTVNSLIPFGASSLGMSFGDFLDKLIEFELKEK